MEDALLLSQAIERNDTGVVTKLIAQKTNVNQDFKGVFPLHTATSLGLQEMTKLLLKAGADVNKRNNVGSTALHLTKIHFITQTLIDHGSHVNATDNLGCTPLHRACEAADLEAIKCLLDNGASLDALDSDGRTPVMHVYGRKVGEPNHPDFEKVVSFLLEYSDVNVIDKRGNSILNASARKKLGMYPVIQHVAKLIDLDLFVHPRIKQAISEDYHLNAYYRWYSYQLLRAKNFKLHNSWVTIYNLIIDGRRKLQMYARNRDIVNNLKRIRLFSVFPGYSDEIRDDFKKAMRNRRAWDKAAICLCGHLPIFDPYHLIIRNTLDCLCPEDLLTLLYGHPRTLRKGVKRAR